jgi:hypothetical protein
LEVAPEDVDLRMGLRVDSSLGVRLAEIGPSAVSLGVTALRKAAVKSMVDADEASLTERAFGEEYVMYPRP